MVWILLGGLTLAALLLSANRIASVDPRLLAQGVRWGGLAALAAASLVVLRSGRFAFLLLPALQRLMRQAFSSMPPRYAPGAARPRDVSVVETPTVRMNLDHETGTLDGEVLAGSHRGKRLGELSVGEVIALCDRCRGEDSEAVSLLEAYLDRREPLWREGWRQGPSQSGNEAPLRRGDAMGRREALEVLGLSEAANEDEIRAAHHRLMKQAHPDHGGTAYLASKINQARDVLLRE